MVVSLLIILLLALQGVFISKIAEGGTAERDERLLVGDKVLSVSCADICQFVIWISRFKSVYKPIGLSGRRLFHSTKRLGVSPRVSSIFVRLPQHLPQKVLRVTKALTFSRRKAQRFSTVKLVLLNLANQNEDSVFLTNQNEDAVCLANQVQRQN